MKTAEIRKAIGGSLGKPGKMPGASYGLSARECITGSKLRAVEGSVCAGCYAMGGNYVTRSVLTAHENRRRAIEQLGWVDGMVAAIEKSGDAWFRWHDAGDLQGVWHFASIVEIALRLPNVRFWLPTKEPAILGQFIRAGGRIPENLIVRVSMPMRGQRAVLAHTLRQAGILTSTVDSGEGFVCPAVHGEHRCDAHACRACWDVDVANVDYPYHR